MADSTTTIQINLRSSADTSGVQRMNDALNGGSGGNPWITASRNAQVHAATLNQNVAPAHDRVAGSSRNMGNAVLQGSRAIQDMQYGLAGAVNNLEGIAGALGFGAGVAGAVTLVAVAVQTLGPAVVEWFKSLDTEGKKLDELKTKLREGAATILGEWTPASQAAKDEADQFTDSIKAQAAAFSVLDKSQQASLDILKKRQSVDAEIAKTKEENDIAEIKAKNLPKEEEAGAIAAVKLAKAKADRERELGTLQGEQTIAGEAVNNTTQEAEMAAKRKKALEDEKQRSLLQAALEQEIGGTVDEKGNVIKAGSLDRIKAAEADVAGADKLRGMPGIDPAFAEQERIKARDKLKQEQQRHDDLTKESRDNIAANGGDQFRKVETIDKELSQADSAAEAAAKKQQAAEFEKSQLDKLQFEQKRKIENDYSQAQNKAVAGLPTDERKPKTDHERLTDPFEQQANQRARRPQRDLIAEESQPRESTRRDLVAEEKNSAAAAMKELAEASKQSDAALMDEIKRMVAEKKKLAEQLKGMRS
jgi:hypothetical protein